MRPELSALLQEIELRVGRNALKGNRYLQRPEKQWEKILGWQCLRSQEFYFGGNSRVVLREGDVMQRHYGWDRYYVLTHTPLEERMLGRLLHPGRNFTHEECAKETKGMDIHEQMGAMIYCPVADERGLYLPLYDSALIQKATFQKIEEYKTMITDHLVKNFHAKRSDLL